MKPLVLVVDDDPEIREAIADALEVEGYRVAVASNGAEGLDRLAEARPDVILLDLAMPVMDGEAFMGELLRGPHGDVPVAIVSGEGNPRRAAQIGAQAFLAKPFELEDLVTQVASLTAKP